MKAWKKFLFTDTDESLEVTIEETIQEDYGLYVWPSAPVLAQYVWYNREKLSNLSILEIGAGTALPGIIAAKCGAKVTLSDSHRSTDALQTCHANLRLNNINDAVVLAITWGHISPSLLMLSKVDLILGSDCFYDSKDFEDILVSVSVIIRQNPNCKFWTTYQQRRTIEYFLRKWDLKSRLIPLPSFNADGEHIAGFDMLHSPTIELLEITARN